MKNGFNAKWVLGSMFAVSVLTVASVAFADDEGHASRSSSAESSSGFRPEFPRFQIEDYGGGLGGSEQGVALNGTLNLRSSDGSWARLRGTVGAPLLQVNGSTEMIPVRLVRTPVDVGNRNHEVQFRLDVVPVSADVQLQVALPSEGSNHHLIVDPSLAAELDWLSPESMGLGARIRTTLGPAGGVIRDGDGASGLFGIQVGVETGLNLSLTPRDELDLLCGVDLLNAVHGGVSPTSTRGRCELGYRRTLGEQGSLRVALVNETSSFDVRQGSNSDDGWTQFSGVGVTFTPAARSAARSRSGD